MITVQGHRLTQIGETEYEMEKNYQGAPIKIFAVEKLLKNLDREVFTQALNVAQLPGLVGAVCIMPDAHSGYGAPIGTVFAMDGRDGYVSPGAVGYDINCGMRLIRTNLFFKDIAPHIEKLVTLLYDEIPPGVGRRGFLKIGRSDLKHLVEEGILYLLEKGIGWEEDIKHIEKKGKIEGADFSRVSDQAVDRGIHQVATLGSGNHYLEIQRVDKIFDENKAANLGLLGQDQIVVMVHCGSRGFGHQVCSDYLKLFEKHLAEFKIPLSDRQLVAAPLATASAKDYLAAMAAAANFAFVNREAITHQIRKAFEKTLGVSSDKSLGMSLVYDVSHNIAQFEEHQGSRLLIHRKGATRSFPGQPVIIGGSMETGSYLLIGTDGAMEKSFGSTAHGSGRTMSRAKAKRMVEGKKLMNAMKQKGIQVKASSLAGLAEEAGFAYKDISDVVKSVDLADISSPVAYFKPIGNIKG